MWGLAASLSIVMVSAQAGSANAGGEAPPLRIWLGNQAAVPPDLIAAAKDNLGTLLRATGVQVVWNDDPSQTPRVLIALIAPEDRAKYLKVRDPEALGVTLRSRQIMGTVYVFFGRVDRAARAHRVDTALVLAYALAHEIGHALLPTGSHTPWGIMRGAWDDQQFRLIASGALGFSAAEAAAIRHGLERREQPRDVMARRSLSRRPARQPRCAGLSTRPVNAAAPRTSTFATTTG